MNLNLFNYIYRVISPEDKYVAEEKFWCEEINKYIRWYNGEISSHYSVSSPKNSQKKIAYTIQQSAILTWFELHQKKKYLIDLNLQKDIFIDKVILDIGSGPFPSAECFDVRKLYCLDPLMPVYIKAGYPIHLYQDSTRFVSGFSEEIPFADSYFDAVISMNAIDHVDDLFKTSKEISRVLKEDGMIRIHAHYHIKTVTEPIELNDKIMKEAFSWCKGFVKINETKEKVGSQAGNLETYTLWSNFT